MAIRQFKIKTLDEILDGIRQRITTKFPGLNFSDESYSNQIIASPAFEISECWEMLEFAGYSIYPKYSKGENLDYSLTFTGNSRLRGSRQVIEVTYKGSGSTFPKNSIFFHEQKPEFNYITKNEVPIKDGETFTMETLQDIDYDVNPGETVQPKSIIKGLDKLTIKRIVQRGLVFEEDEDAVDRYYSQLALQAKTPIEAIEAEIKQVRGVTKVLIINNNTDQPDFEGRPAGSMEIIVSGGNDADVAEAVWSAVAPGTTLVGIPYKVSAEQIVRFSRAISKPIYFSIEITINPLQFKASEAEIIETFVNRCRETFTQGDDIILSPTCIGFLTGFSGITFIVIRAGVVKGIYDASSGSKQFTDMTGDGVVDRNDLSALMAIYNAERAVQSTGRVPIDRDESPLFLKENVLTRIVIDTATAVKVPIEIQGNVLVDQNFPMDAEDLIISAFQRTIDNIEAGRSISSFQTLSPAIQGLGVFREIDIRVKKKGEASFSQYIDIAPNQLAFVERSDIRVNVRRLNA